MIRFCALFDSTDLRRGLLDEALERPDVGDGQVRLGRQRDQARNRPRLEQARAAGAAKLRVQAGRTLPLIVL